MPDFTLETRAMAAGALHVAGIDEVGRGPMAGPVTAAAVILDPLRIPEGLRDSKTLTPPRRDALARQIREVAQVGIGHASVAEIDALNILRASHLAMERAVSALPNAPDHLLIDGTMLPEPLAARASAVIKGDARSLSIAAASIIAKVCRDAVMCALAQECPGYGWERNAGYITRFHKDALLRLGVSVHHRRSFAPVRAALQR
ncbi:MAG: ribonuclease HII [Rhodobacteraceae bacterium]|nr:MAG: ribonuclease HII [Paracoccaceae bacterium]